MFSFSLTDDFWSLLLLFYGGNKAAFIHLILNLERDVLSFSISACVQNTRRLEGALVPTGGGHIQSILLVLAAGRVGVGEPLVTNASVGEPVV